MGVRGSSWDITRRPVSCGAVLTIIGGLISLPHTCVTVLVILGKEIIQGRVSIKLLSVYVQIVVWLSYC